MTSIGQYTEDLRSADLARVLDDRDAYARTYARSAAKGEPDSGLLQRFLAADFEASYRDDIRKMGL